MDIKKTLELIEASKLIPGLMDEISPNLVKVFGKLFKDHIGSNIRPDERAQNIQGIHSKYILKYRNVTGLYIVGLLRNPYFIALPLRNNYVECSMTTKLALL